MFNFIPIVNKSRKPKFELHLKIYDLNNVPLVTGNSIVKWYLPHSIHGDHRGRTAKCPITNHRVDYNYSKLILLRIGIDKYDNLEDCPILLEVLQEFSSTNGGGGGRDEKITLGVVRLNLAEYVEESETVARDGLSPDLGQHAMPGARISIQGGRSRSSTVRRHHYHRHDRKQSGGTASSIEAISLTRRPSAGDETSGRTAVEEERVQEGIVRRYLMQDSKINSTLKIGILMIQLDGDRNFATPPLRTAPVFGGIAGIMGAEPVEGQEETGQLPTLSKNRDTSEHQDMYRCALAASWSCQPGELPANECIEDIFAGGTGWRPDKRKGGRKNKVTNANDEEAADETADEGTPNWGFEWWRGSGAKIRGGRLAAGRLKDWEQSISDLDGAGALKPSDLGRIKHIRVPSASPNRSSVSVIGPSMYPNVNVSDPFLATSTRNTDGSGKGRKRGSLRSEETVTPASASAVTARENDRRNPGVAPGSRSRSDSLASLATTLGSDGRIIYDGYGRQREFDEFEIREDLVAWSLHRIGS